MSKFVCKNKDCSKYGIVDEYFVNIYKTVDGKSQSNNAPCPVCGNIREELKDDIDVPVSEWNISIGEYSSASPEERKRILKDRSHQHYVSEIKSYKKHKISEAVRNFKSIE